MTTGGIIAVGDSITAHCSPDLCVDGVPALSWAQWVGESLGQPLTTYAKPGAAAYQILELLPDNLPSSELALVFAGVNDILSWRHWREGTLASGLAAILERVTLVADRTLVVQIPDDLGKNLAVLPYGPGLQKRVRVAQGLVAGVVAETGATLVTPPDLRLGNRMWVDGVHPTSSGHLAMADAALSVLGAQPASSLGFQRALSRSDFAAFKLKWAAWYMFRQPVVGNGSWLLNR